MYSTTTSFKDIKAVRPCLTLFEVQVVRREMIREAEHAVQPSSGLHASVTSKTASRKTEWVDIGATTVPFVTDILKKQQPVTWNIFTSIALRRPRIQNGVAAIRQQRPVEAVSTSQTTIGHGNILQAVTLDLRTRYCIFGFLAQSERQEIAYSKRHLILCIIGASRPFYIQISHREHALV
jgi:hypothetical protein